jgi:type I restriction enzyme S subunit
MCAKCLFLTHVTHSGARMTAPLQHAASHGDDLPQGYKRTEVGVIPVDWEVRSFGEVFDFLPTATNSRADLSEHGEIAYIHYGDIHTKWHNFLDFKVCDVPNIDAHKVKSASLLQEGDLVMADASEDYNGISKSIEIQNLENRKAVAGLHTFLLREKSGFVAKGYRGYIQDIKPVKVAIDRVATGLKVYGVSKNNLRNIPIPLPPLPEQTAIAGVLSDVDGLIASLTALIAKKRAVKHATMQQLLTGKTRLAGFTGAWEVKRLGDVLNYEQPVKYIVNDTEYNDYNQTPVLTAGKTFILGYTNETHGVYENTPVIIFDDFTTSSKYVDFSFKVKSSAIKLLTAKDDNSLRFIFEKMQTLNFVLGDHKRYYISEYQQLQIPLPPLPEQTAIAAILTDMDTDITTLETRLIKTKALKTGMCQELLTGKTRLL